MKSVNIKEVKELAEKEVQDEFLDEAKDRVKNKLRRLTDAQTVVENVKRELEDLYDEISQGN